MLAFSRKIFCTSHIKSRFQSETCLGQNFRRLLQHHNNNIRALCNKNFLVSSNWHILKFVSTVSSSHLNSLLCVSGEKKMKNNWMTKYIILEQNGLLEVSFHELFMQAFMKDKHIWYCNQQILIRWLTLKKCLRKVLWKGFNDRNQFPADYFGYFYLKESPLSKYFLRTHW